MKSPTIESKQKWKNTIQYLSLLIAVLLNYMLVMPNIMVAAPQ
ncbi:hypothetical protein [Photobacterium galatheae]|nr:hypothetical protein [Photobacterium galatheae]